MGTQYKASDRDLASRVTTGIKSWLGQGSPTVASAGLRATYFVAAAISLGLWGWSLIPAIENWNNPNEDGFSLIPAFYASITMLPVGLILLAGGIAGRGKPAARARLALFTGSAFLLLTAAFGIFFVIANTIDRAR